MNLLYISTSRVPSRGANSVHVMKMCNALSKNGHSVHLMTAKVEDEIEKNVTDIFGFYGVEKSFSLYRLPWFDIPNFAFVYALQIMFVFLFLTIKNFERPHCYSRFTMGLYLVSFFGPKLTYEMHSELPKMKSEQFIFRQLIKRKSFSRLVVISKNLADEIILDFPELRDKITIAHDGADIIDKTVKVNLPNHGNISTVHLGYVGHLYKGRGIKLLTELVTNKPDLHLHLIGGSKDDISFWEKETAQQANITLHGFISPKETVAYRNSMDILLAPYEEEIYTSRWMSPLKIFEYMSAQKPIICSDLEVLREVLHDKINALLCPPNTLIEWEKAIAKIRTDKNFAEELSQKAYIDFMTHYTWQKRAERVLE